MGDKRLPENQPGRVPWYKHVLRHKKEQLTFPPFMEGHHQLFSQEELEDVTRDYEPSEELSQNIRGTFFPRISHGVPSPDTKKCQRKLSKDSGLFSSVSKDQQGSRRTKYKLDRLSKTEDDDEDHFINLLQMPKHNQNLNKGLQWENQMEANNKYKLGNHLRKKLYLGSPENSRSFQRNFLPTSTSRNENFLDSPNYEYIQRGDDNTCEGNEALENLDVLQQFDQPTHEDSTDKKNRYLSPKLKDLRGLSKEKDTRLSKQESNFEINIQNSQDPFMSTNEKFKCGLLYQKPKQLKALSNIEPVTDHNSALEIQGRSFDKPDLLENLYGTIAFKDFIIQKGYDMPGILKKFFMRKGWSYNYVNTPIPSALKDHELIMQKQDNEDDEEEIMNEFD